MTIPDIRRHFGILVGLSDHTTSNTASVVATALGACLIEKHFILDRNDKGADSEFSIEPSELTNLCKTTKNAWLSLGSASYDKRKAEESNLVFRRSVYFVKDMKAGEIITKEHIRRIRPGFGLAPKYESQLIGKKVKTDIQAGTSTNWLLIHE